MAAPTAQGLGTFVGVTTGSAVDWPTHQSGDIGLLVVEALDTDTITLGTANGFVEVPGSPNINVGTTQLAVFWCRATSSSMASPVLNDAGTHIAAKIVTIRGCVATGDPWDVIATGTKSPTSTSVSIPGLTTTVADTLIVAIAARASDQANDQYSSVANASLTGVTEWVDEGTIAANGGGFLIAYGTKATAGVVSATTATLANQSTESYMTLALKPAASAVDLTAADASQAHSAQSPTITQGHEVAAGNASQAQSVDAPSVSQAHEVTAANAAQAQSASAPAITQVHEIAPANSAHTHSAGSPSVDQEYSDNVIYLGGEPLMLGGEPLTIGESTAVPISTNGATHSHSAGTPAITQVHSISPNNAAHGHASESPAITAVHSLVVADATQAHTAGTPALTQVHTVASADATHAQTSTSPALSGAGNIGPDNSAHSHSASNPAVTQLHVLSASSAVHAQTSGEPSLTQVHQVAAASAVHAHVAQSPVVTWFDPSASAPWGWADATYLLPRTGSTSQSFWTDNTVREGNWAEYVQPSRWIITVFDLEEALLPLTLVAVGTVTQGEVPESLLIRVMRPTRAGGPNNGALIPVELFDATPAYDVTVHIEQPNGNVLERAATILDPTDLDALFPDDFAGPEEGWIQIVFQDGDFNQITSAGAPVQIQLTIDNGVVRLKTRDVWEIDVADGPAAAVSA